MRTLISFILTTIIASGPALGQSAQTHPDDRYRIRLIINGAPVDGSQERSAQLVGKSAEEQRAILDAPLPTLRVGSTHLLKVLVTDPNGVTSNHSSSGRLRFEAFGCMRIRASEGELTVWPRSNLCSNQQQPSLWIVFVNQQGAPIVHNEYLFQTCSNC